MSVWKRMAPFRNRELYYYDTNQNFETAELAARLYMMIRDELEKSRKEKVLLLCIGTDRSTGDSLGPLIGYLLKNQELKHIRVLGTLNRPVHAMNLEDTLSIVEQYYQDHVIVAVDASVGMHDHIGCITVGRGSLKPGLGVSKELRSVGDLFITGVVSSCGDYDPLMLQSIRLSVVMRMAECISESVCIVEKLWESMALV
ncbi:MAG: spore protease YyaC [Hungatella sp.]|jgi:putative sporulation protein YyaC|nr:spore protease YyaC [Hungatella sp.]